MPLLTASSMRAALAEHGLRPSRALGQNFLADPNTARRIARLADVGRGDHVLEIGPGLGSLTLALAETGADVLALELDRHLAPVLRDVIADADRVSIEVGDALAVDLEQLVRDHADGPWQCVANLPYNVAAPVVVRLLEEAPTIEHILVMVQREVAERIAAAPGTPAYGALSVKVAYYAEADIAGLVPATVFLPKPKVESALVRLARRAAPPVAVPDPARLFALVRAGFGQRRKMLRRSLRAALGDRVETVLRAAGVDPAARAESLGLEQWAAVANAASTETEGPA